MLQKIKRYVWDAVHCVDPVLLICATLLSLISIVTVWGAVDNFGMSKLRMQIAMFVVGTVAMIVVASFDYHAIVDKLWKPMLIASILLLVLTLLFGSSGESRETANKSWLEIPIINYAIQPSEFVKFSLICTFSLHLFNVKKKINHPLTILGLALHAGSIVGLILLSGDLGVALVYMALIAIMLFCAGLHPAYFGGAILLIVLIFPFLWDHLAEYQRMRILVGFRPELDPEIYGWQPLLSRSAIAAGGFFGQGVKGGSIYEALPASHTDFIYATVCEKFGFLGGALVIILFLILVVRIFMIARTADRSDYGGLICVGVAAVFVVQILENVGMCFAMLPVVGITLPFLSCGGSSMLATFLMLGLVHNVFSHSRAVRAEQTPETLDIDISLMDS